jgi:hypothetical protein
MRLERTEQTTDHLTGEVTKRTSTVVQLNKLPPEPEYIKLYVDDIGKLHGLSPTHREVLLYVAAASGYDGIATISTRRKAAIALTIGGSVKTVSNALTECVKAGLLRRVAHGEYEPNPFIFGRGSWAEIRERRERFVASFVYGPQGRQVLETRRLSPEEAERLDKVG